MAKKVNYGEAKPHWRLTFEVNGKQYEADGYESEYFAGKLPEGKYDYYARHDDSDWMEIVGIKKHKGLTVNFWGTVVTDEPIDFGDSDEVEVSAFDYAMALTF